MDPALRAAASGMMAQQLRTEVISNNLANVNTTGFKRSRAAFEDLMYQNDRQPGAQSSQATQVPSGTMVGTGVRVVGTEKLFTQGEVVQTNNPLDIAVQGRGFLQVTMPDGTVAYTRDGSFHLNSDGQIVTNSGYPVEPALTVPANAQSITIGTDGTVSVQLPGQAAPAQIGTVQTADFINPAGLEPRGENLFVETASSGAPQTGTPGLNGLGTITQGSLESSNVNVVEELVNMISAQRVYETNSKVITTADRMLGTINQAVS